MTTVVTIVLKFNHNRIHMGMCTLVDILQAKVDKLLGYIKGIKTYIDDILFLSKEIFSKHINI